ncbi:unnamed protein product [Rotaria sp. Silwood1]|nr:unnamed protein product [Rotaria sp. Silwood1]
MLYIFRVDIGETYTFDTELAFQDVKTLKSTIEHEHGIASSKQILIINGGELLDDDAVQVCMKTRETCAGTEENPIYLLDKSHLERSLPLQIPLTSNSIPILDNATVEQWLAMPSTYETIVQRADTAQNFNKYAQKLVQNCERFVRDQQAQYQGWMAVIANVEDTLSSFLLNRNSFNRLYQNYISERSSYLELFQSLPRAIKILHQLKLPNKLIALIDNVNGINYKSTVSSSASSSSISSATTTSSNYVTQNENDIQTEGDMSLFEWITAQLLPEQPIQPTVNNLLMEACFKSSPNESSNAVELYTPFAASPPSQITNPLLAQTTVPISSVVSSSPIVSSTSRISTLTINSPPQATPIAFFTVNRSDHVIIYFDTTYQHYMIFTYLSTLHFIHSDCYELFNIQQKQNSNQQINNTNVIDSISTDNGKNLTNIPSLINTSMINSALIGNNVFNPSTTPLLGQVTDKEYCQAKKANNRFNVPLGTKFYRVRVKPWKPTISSSPN